MHTVHQSVDKAEEVAEANNQWGLLETQQAEGRERQRAIVDPGGFHGDIAAAELHWYDAASQRWLNCSPAEDAWHAIGESDGTLTAAEDLTGDWRPWREALDERRRPVFPLVLPAPMTNACFNEVDRHVLARHGESTHRHHLRRGPLGPFQAGRQGRPRLRAQRQLPRTTDRNRAAR